MKNSTPKTITKLKNLLRNSLNPSKTKMLKLPLKSLTNSRPESTELKNLNLKMSLLPKKPRELRKKRNQTLEDTRP